MAKGYGASLKRWLLQQRINILRSDIFVMLERKDHASMTIESLEYAIGVAQKKLRRLQSKLILSESPRALLDEAMSE